MTCPNRTNPWRGAWLLPVLFALILAVATVASLWVMQIESVSLSLPRSLTDWWGPQASIPLLPSLLTWGLCATTFTFVSFLASSIFCANIAQALDGFSRRAFWTAGASALGFALAGLLALGATDVPVFPRYTQELLELVDLPNVMRAVSWLNGLALAAGFLACFAFCSNLAILRKEDIKLRELGRAINRLHRNLYAATGVLIFGVLEISALYHLPAKVADLAGYEHAHYVARLANQTSVTAGVIYTLLLAAMYLPAALTLRMRAEQVADAIEQEKRSKTLATYGIASTPSQTLLHIIAVLGPILTAGPAVTLFEIIVRK